MLVKGSEKMLIQFKYKNHKCFSDEAILDLTATQEKRHLESTIDINGNKLLPVIAIHGANAAGKSSVLEALSFMFKTIKNSISTDIAKPLSTEPFAFEEKRRKANSEYEISIALGDYEYRYGFSMNANRYDEEWLYKNKFSATTTASQKIIFERTKNNVEFGSSYKKIESIWNFFTTQMNINPDKLLLLSIVASKEESGELRSIYEYICKFCVILEKTPSNPMTIEVLDEKSSLFKKFQKKIREFDPCLVGINVQEVTSDDKVVGYKLDGVHKSFDSEKEIILLPFQKESAGTIKIHHVLPAILRNLEQGGLLCIDELDIQFHPLLYKKIVNMYTDKKINKNNAQLIFTAHSTYLFNSENMRRDEIYLVQKNNVGKSNLYSLSEFRNLRVDADYEKKYLTGQFGAIPFQDE